MNMTTPTQNHHKNQTLGAAKLLKVAAWGAISSMALCGSIRGSEGPGLGAPDQLESSDVSAPSGAGSDTTPDSTPDAAPDATADTTPASTPDSAAPQAGVDASDAISDAPTSDAPTATAAPEAAAPDAAARDAVDPSIAAVAPDAPAIPTPALTQPAAADAGSPEILLAPPVTQPLTQPATEPVATLPSSQPAASEPSSQPSTTQSVTTMPATSPATTEVSVPTPPPAPPKETIVSKGLDDTGAVSLMLNKSAVLTTKVPYKRVSIAQPEIADIKLIGPSEILVTAKKAGNTELIIWDDEEKSQVIEVAVRFDLHGVESQIAGMFPKAKITVENANGSIVLRGHVPNLLTAQQAVSVATPYAAGGPNAVLNFLEVSGGQQVVVQVRFAEVSRTLTQSLGFNAFATDGKMSLGLGNGGAGAAPTVSNAATIGTNNGTGNFPLYGGAAAGNATFEFFLQALRTNNLLRILAEPNVTAISGQQASFLAGGEFPVPVPQTSGGGTAITIEYKQYGIQLQFTPTVLGDGRIRLQVNPTVSELDFAHAVLINGTQVPGLTNRTVNTTVELAEGQTFALAGLLDNEVTANKGVTPLLGDLPVLGALFRSVSYQRQETELVVLVTPRLVEAMNPHQVPQLPGELWRDPTDLQLFLNQDLGGPATDMRHAPPVKSAGFYGHTGFSAAPESAVAPR